MSTLGSSPPSGGRSHRAGSTAPTVQPGVASDASLVELVSDLAAELQKLLKQEMALARAELRREATRAAAGAGMLGVAGFAGYMVVVLGSFAAAFGLANVMDLAWATLVVVGAWALVGGIMLASGAILLRRVSPVPVRTIESLKQTLRWSRGPQT